jgi:ATP-dependent helicase HrpA
VHGSLLDAVAAELSQIGGARIGRDDFDQSRLPPHLRMTFRVVDGDKVLASGKDLDELRSALRPRLESALTAAAADIVRTGLTDWPSSSLPRVFRHGQMQAYPALADAGNAVDVRLFGTQADAEAAMRDGIRRLLLLKVPSGVRSIAGRLPTDAKLAMSAHPYPSAVAFLDDCAACAAGYMIDEAGGPAWDREGFERLVQAARDGLAVATSRVLDVVPRLLAASHEASLRLSSTTSGVTASRLGGGSSGEPASRLGGGSSGVTAAPEAALEDMRRQLAGLVYPGFISQTGLRRLPDLVRYLKAIVRRLDKMGESLPRDAERMATVHRVTDEYREAIRLLPESERHAPAATDVRWMIEELRVSLFAQTLGTPVPVSEKRIYAMLDRLAG